MTTAASPGIEDATKRSTSHTDLRIASERWEAWKAGIRRRLANDEFMLSRTLSREELVVASNDLYRLALAMADLIDVIRWPAFDTATSLKSDERAFEQAARHLETTYSYPAAGAEQAWGLVFSAVSQYAQWRDNPHYAAIGVDLGAFFAAELDATLRVVMRDHLRRVEAAVNAAATTAQAAV
jgi:hypothetical protein